MKTFISKTLSLLLCLCLLFTMIPVHAAEPGNNTGTTTETEQPPQSEDSSQTESEPAPKPVPIKLTGSMYKKLGATLKWNTDDKNATYNILRSTSKDSGFKKIGSKTGKTGTYTFTQTSLKLGTTYYYKVRKLVNGEVVTTSNTVSVRIRLRPVENFKVTVTSDNKVKLTWDKTSYATSYIIYRSNTKNGTYKKIANPVNNEYVDKNVYAAESYYYKIRAWKKNVSSAQSVLSDIKAAYTKNKKPTVTAKYASSKVTISWSNLPKADKYYVSRLNAKGIYVRIAETANLTYTDKNVSANKYYSYKVRGVYTADKKNILGFMSNAAKVYTSKIDPNKKMVALTFDDGPGPHTDEIVDCLKANGARATFFVVGNRVSTYADEMKYAYDNGNEIANHTYSHPTLTSLSVAKIKSEVSKTDAAVKEVTGEAPTLIRAPGGATNSTVRNAVDKPFIYWSIDTLDWKHRNSATTVNTVMNQVRDGSIVLMHDIHSPTKTAALELIPKLKKAGYQLVTVSELAMYRGYKLQSGTTYYSFGK